MCATLVSNSNSSPVYPPDELPPVTIAPFHMRAQRRPGPRDPRPRCPVHRTIDFLSRKRRRAPRVVRPPRPSRPAAGHLHPAYTDTANRPVGTVQRVRWLTVDGDLERLTAYTYLTV